MLLFNETESPGYKLKVNGKFGKFTVSCVRDIALSSAGLMELELEICERR